MFAVIFEVFPEKKTTQEYLAIASELKQQLTQIEGFISIERFSSLNKKGKVLSLSFWESEQAIEKWRNLACHREAQSKGRQNIFTDYRIRVAKVERDYGMNERKQTPNDSKKIHD